MPLYRWADADGKEIEVIRTFDDFEVPPTEEEAPEFTAPWTRLLGISKVIKGYGWGAGKGAW